MPNEQNEEAPVIRGQYNKVIGFVLPLSKKCNTHKKEELGYMAWYADCERRRIDGQKQTQCPTCGHWYWPDEM